MGIDFFWVWAVVYMDGPILWDSLTLDNPYLVFCVCVFTSATCFLSFKKWQTTRAVRSRTKKMEYLLHNILALILPLPLLPPTIWRFSLGVYVGLVVFLLVCILALKVYTKRQKQPQKAKGKTHPMTTRSKGRRSS